MVGSVAWFVVILPLAVAVGVSTHVTQVAAAMDTETGSHRALALALASLAALVAVAVLWRSWGIARADGSVVSALARLRGEALNDVMTVVTTMGDVVPSFAIAAALALIIYLQGRHHYLPWALPALVLVQLAIQFAFGHVFHDITLSQIRPYLPLGGTGSIPSGSVSRLLAIFLVAGRFWASYDGRGAWRVVCVGASLVLVEAVTRLYLGRHLLADVAGGLLLGLALANGTFFLCRMAGLKLDRAQSLSPNL